MCYRGHSNINISKISNSRQPFQYRLIPQHPFPDHEEQQGQRNAISLGVGCNEGRECGIVNGLNTTII